MIEKYRPDLKDFPTTNVKTTTGDAFAWLEKFDANLRLMNEIQTHPSVVPGKGLLITEAVRGNGAIMISHQGKRFVNELDTRDVTSAAVLALPEKRAYIFFNQDIRKSLKAIEGYDKAGLLVSGKTVEEIAEKLNMDSKILSETLQKYNAAQKSGKDVAHTITTGVGGLVTTNDRDIMEISRSLLAHGRACTCEKCVASDPKKVCPLRMKTEPDKRFRVFMPQAKLPAEFTATTVLAETQ